MSARYGSEGLGSWVLDRLGPGARAPRRRGEPREVDVRAGATVAAVTVRAALALAGAGAALVAATAPGPVVPVPVLALMVLAGVAPAIVPRLPLTAVLLLVVGGRLLLADPAPGLVLVGLVLLLHVVLRLGAVAARTGWRTRVEVAVLSDDWRGAVVAQVAAQVLGLVATAARGALVAVGGADGADSGAASGGLAAGVAAVGGPVWLVLGLAVVVGLTALVLVRPPRPAHDSTTPDAPLSPPQAAREQSSPSRTGRPHLGS